jgi:hypothetical protein
VILRVLCIAVFLISCRGAARNDVKVSYIPFGLQTYAAVTPENIDDDPHSTFHLKATSEDAAQVRAIIERAGAGQFDRLVVRALIEIGGDEKIWIDNDGGVFDGRTRKHLRPDDFATLKSIFNRLAPPFYERGTKQ